MQAVLAAGGLVTVLLRVTAVSCTRFVSQRQLVKRREHFEIDAAIRDTSPPKVESER